MVHNKIRGEINRFMEENNKLTRNVDGLEDQVIKLQDVERQFRTVAERTGATAEELIQLVKENSVTLKNQKVWCTVYTSFHFTLFLFVKKKLMGVVYDIDPCKSRITRTTSCNSITN